MSNDKQNLKWCLAEIRKQSEKLQRLMDRNLKKLEWVDINTLSPDEVKNHNNLLRKIKLLMTVHSAGVALSNRYKTDFEQYFALREAILETQERCEQITPQ